MSTISTLKNELRSLLDAKKDELAEVLNLRSSMARVDGYVSILRRVIMDSSLCYIDGVLSFYDGKSYVKVEWRALSIAIANMLPNYGAGASDIRKTGDMPLSVIYEKSFDSDKSKVCFANCVYDMDKNTAYSFDPKFISSYCLDYEYIKNQSSPMWCKFLEEVLPDDTERSCLQEFFGMCYVDRDKLSIEKMALLIGRGSNGKSVVFDVIKRAVGLQWVTFLTPEQLTDSKQVVSVCGKKLNFSPDLKSSSSFDSGLKALSSSQDIQGWRIYEGNVVVKCPPLIFAFNDMPKFRDDTDAFFRRLLIFSFDVTIPVERQDKELASKICENELGGVFKWIMDGRKRLIANNGEFTLCKKMNFVLESLKWRIKGDRSPVLTYLDSIGYSATPYYPEQPTTIMYASSIVAGMKGRISRNAITRELNDYNVKHDRGTEMKYYIYKKI